MPNGFDKNLYRVYEVVDGFRESFGRWPTAVRMPSTSLLDLLQNVLTPAGRIRLEACLTLIPDEAEFAAEDETGRRYVYGSRREVGKGGAAGWLALDHLRKCGPEID